MKKRLLELSLLKSRNCNPFILFSSIFALPIFSLLFIVLLQITAMFTVLLRAKTAFFLFFFFNF